MNLPRLPVLLTSLCLALSAQAADHWTVPVHSKRLANGLTVLVSPDASSPTVGLSVIYKVGLRLEPKGRSGFAHLFEHLMFQGTPKAPKGVLVQVIAGGGGSPNASVTPNFTRYVEGASVAALERLLWLEADRMTTLDFNIATLKNEQNVVKEEVRQNVQNQPYGFSMVIDIAGLAFDKWENSHDGYGSFVDLDNATLDEVKAFHRDYYGPNNAVLSMAGAVTPAQGFALAEKYFGKIAARPTPKQTDFREGLNRAERRLVQADKLAAVPAIVAAWKLPDRGSADQAPFAVLGELLAGGDASRFHQGLIKGKELALNINTLYGLTGVWDYDGPGLFTVFALYKPNSSANAMLDGMDAEIIKVVQDGVDEASLRRVKTRLLANWYNGLESFLDRADMLARLQTQWGDAEVVNRIPGWIQAVKSEDLQRVARTYLTAANRSVIDRKPAAMLAPETASTAH